MQNKWICFFTAAFLLFNFAPTKVWAAIDTEELTYDDLVTQLSEKRDQSQKKNANANPSVKSHLGLGILSSFNQISKDGKTASVNPSGFSLSTGMDLNSERVRGEIEFRNYGDLGQGSTQSGNLRELAGQIQVRKPLNPKWQMKFAGGLALRMLHFSDSAEGLDVDDTSSMFIVGSGIEAKLSTAVALGADLSTHFPFGTTTSDRSSIDFGLKLDTSF